MAGKEAGTGSGGRAPRKRLVTVPNTWQRRMMHRLGSWLWNAGMSIHRCGVRIERHCPTPADVRLAILFDEPLPPAVEAAAGGIRAELKRERHPGGEIGGGEGVVTNDDDGVLPAAAVAPEIEDGSAETRRE